MPLPNCKNPLIVVYKSKSLMVLYDDNHIIARFPVSTGANPGDKEREGDKCTPEGEFYVCVKNPQSKYIVSLGLSYPDIEDAARGIHDGLISKSQHDRIVYAIEREQQPPWDTPLGGEIMIHGCRNGGRGTLGCIALEDDAIRLLYPRIKIGTRVLVKP